MEYLSYRMIESIRMAQHDPANAESHLCLVAQLCTIARTMIREDLFRIDEPTRKQGPKTPLMCGHKNPDGGTICILPENHGMKHMDSFNNYWDELQPIKTTVLCGKQKLITGSHPHYTVVCSRDKDHGGNHSDGDGHEW